jgi:hypothetical protein
MVLLLAVNFQFLFYGALGTSLGGGQTAPAERFLDGAQTRAFFRHVSSD